MLTLEALQACICKYFINISTQCVENTEIASGDRTSKSIVEWKVSLACKVKHLIHNIAKWLDTL